MHSCYGRGIAACSIRILAVAHSRRADGRCVAAAGWKRSRGRAVFRRLARLQLCAGACRRWPPCAGDAAVSEAGRTARRLKNADWLTHSSLTRLLDVLSQGGEEARVAGGAVRNALMDLPPGYRRCDDRLARGSDPPRDRRRFQGGAHRHRARHRHCRRVRHAFRSDDIAHRRRDLWPPGDRSFRPRRKADAERRDFTINAMPVTVDGTVYDYGGGLKDLEARRVRFFGDLRGASPRTICASCAFSAFTPPMAMAHRMPPGCRPASPDEVDLSSCRASACGWSCSSFRREGAAPVLSAMQEAGILVALLGGVPLIADVARMAAIEAARSAPRSGPPARCA